MSNYLGDFVTVTSRKTQDLIAALSDTYNKDNRMLLLAKLLVMSNNPAYQAAMIVALKSSNRLEAIKQEISAPSFSIENHDNHVPNEPSEFTQNYESVTDFVDNTYTLPITPANGVEENGGRVIVKSGQIVASFAIPVIGIIDFPDV